MCLNWLKNLKKSQVVDLWFLSQSLTEDNLIEIKISLYREDFFGCVWLIMGSFSGFMTSVFQLILKVEG